MTQKFRHQWRNLPPELMERIPATDLSYIMAEVERDGKQEMAEARIAALRVASDRRLSGGKENIAPLIALVVGAFTFSVAPQMLSSQVGRGPLAIPAGLVGGAAASFFAHANATRVLAGLRLKQGTAQERSVLMQNFNRENH